MKLVRFLMKLTNETVTVELKNGTVVQGSIVNVSPTMNITLKKVKMTIRHRDPINVDFINIRGNNVRQVHLPDAINLDLLLQDSTSTHNNNNTSSSSSGGKKRKAEGQAQSNKRVRRAL